MAYTGEFANRITYRIACKRPRGGIRLATLILTIVPIDHVAIDHVAIDHVDIDHVSIDHRLD